MVNVQPNPRPVIKIPTIEEMIVVNFIFVYQLIVHSSEVICMIPKKKPGYLPGFQKDKLDDSFNKRSFRIGKVRQ